MIGKWRPSEGAGVTLMRGKWQRCNVWMAQEDEEKMFMRNQVKALEEVRSEKEAALATADRSRRQASRISLAFSLL